MGVPQLPATARVHLTTKAWKEPVGYGGRCYISCALSTRLFIYTNKLPLLATLADVSFQ